MKCSLLHYDVLVIIPSNSIHNLINYIPVVIQASVFLTNSKLLSFIKKNPAKKAFLLA